MCGTAIPDSKSAKQREMDYKAESDFRTLKDADEVRSDKDRHGRAIAHGRKSMASISRVVGRGIKSGRAPKRMPSR